MKILVTGLLPYESGKTWFVVSMVDIFKDIGFSPGYFKPVGGHSGWYQLDTLIHSMELGVLVGHDAYVVAEKLGLLDLVDVISPLDIMTFPIDPFKEGVSTRMYIDMMSSTNKITLITRLTNVWENDGGFERVHTYIVARDTYEKLPDTLRESVDVLLEKLRKPNTVFIEANTTFIEKVLENPSTYESIDHILELLANKHNPLIIEGYNDVAAPTPASLSIDIAVVITPGKVAIYRGQRYRQAVELLAIAGRPWTVTVSKVFDILGKPLRVFDIPLMISDKYRKLMEEVVEFITRLQ